MHTSVALTEYPPAPTQRGEAPAGLVLAASKDATVQQSLEEALARYTRDVEVVMLEEAEQLLPPARDEQRRPDLVIFDTRCEPLPRNRLMQALHVRLKLRRIPVVALYARETAPARELFTQSIDTFDERQIGKLARDYLGRHLIGAIPLVS